MNRRNCGKKNRKTNKNKKKHPSRNKRTTFRIDKENGNKKDVERSRNEQVVAL